MRVCRWEQGGETDYPDGMGLLSLLRRLFPRSATPPVTHTLICGASRSGKSEAELARLVPLARRGDCSLVVMDPPGTLARKLLLHLHALGLADRVLYDRLADTDRVPGFDWLAPSVHPDPLQREAENDERVREFAAILLRRRGIQDPARTPLIEEWLLAALRLYLAQQSPVPLPWLPDVFDLSSPTRSRLLASCTDARLVRKIHEHASLSPTARRTEAAPAERILRAVCTSPAFKVRSGEPTFDLGRFLDDRGILILDGNSQGNLSRDAAAVMMGSVILRVIQHCRTRSKNRVVLVLDEAVNAGLIGVHESQALAECGKWGLEFHILIQSPFSFPSEEIRTSVLQNTWRHEWFRQGSPEAARLAAEDVGTPLLDPLKVHHDEKRFRTTDAGYDHIPAESRSETVDEHGRRSRSTSWGTVVRPRRREVAYTQPHYTALRDQILLIQKELMLLQPGWRFVRCDRITQDPEYVPMLGEPRASRGWAECQAGKGTAAPNGTEAGFREVLERMKQSPVYRSPASSAAAVRPADSHPAAATTLARRGATEIKSDVPA